MREDDDFQTAKISFFIMNKKANNNIPDKIIRKVTRNGTDIFVTPKIHSMIGPVSPHNTDPIIMNETPLKRINSSLLPTKTVFQYIIIVII